VILFHGTSERNLESILKDGLLANSEEHSNWVHSNEYENPKGFVYLGYAPFAHAMNSSYDGGRGVVLEVDIPDVDRLYPDAHFMAFPDGRPLNPMPDLATIKERVLKSQHLTSISLERVKGACFLGDIPPSWIKRYVLIDWKARKSMNDLVLQETSMGSYHAKMVEYVLNEKWWGAMPDCFKRTGIEVHSNEKREVSRTTADMLKELIKSTRILITN
jgi:hypothetical protein